MLNKYKGAIIVLKYLLLTNVKKKMYGRSVDKYSQIWKEKFIKPRMANFFLKGQLTNRCSFVGPYGLGHRCGTWRCEVKSALDNMCTNRCGCVSGLELYKTSVGL